MSAQIQLLFQNIQQNHNHHSIIDGKVGQGGTMSFVQVVHYFVEKILRGKAKQYVRTAISTEQELRGITLFCRHHGVKPTSLLRLWRQYWISWEITLYKRSRQLLSAKLSAFLYHNIPMISNVGHHFGKEVEFTFSNGNTSANPLSYCLPQRGGLWFGKSLQHSTHIFETHEDLQTLFVNVPTEIQIQVKMLENISALPSVRTWSLMEDQGRSLEYKSSSDQGSNWGLEIEFRRLSCSRTMFCSHHHYAGGKERLGEYFECYVGFYLSLMDDGQHLPHKGHGRISPCFFATAPDGELVLSTADRSFFLDPTYLQYRGRFQKGWIAHMIDSLTIPIPKKRGMPTVTTSHDRIKLVDYLKVQSPCEFPFDLWSLIIQYGFLQPAIYPSIHPQVGLLKAQRAAKLSALTEESDLSDFWFAGESFWTCYTS